VRNADGSYSYTAVDMTTITFNSSGQMTGKVDPHGLRVTYTYSSTTGPLSTVTQPDGAIATFLYDTHGNLSSIQEPGSRIVTISVDSTTHKLTNIQNPDSNNRAFQYDTMLRMTNQQWGPTNTTIVYDSHGRVSSVQKLNSLGQTDNVTVAAEIEQGISGGTVIANGVGKYTDALGHPTSYTLDGLGRVTNEVTADGAVQSWVRNPAGLATSYTDGLNHTTTYGYSNFRDLGRVLRIAHR
jgi:YD repeat-containing protein